MYWLHNGVITANSLLILLQGVQTACEITVKWHPVCYRSSMIHPDNCFNFKKQQNHTFFMLIYIQVTDNTSNDFQCPVYLTLCLWISVSLFSGNVLFVKTVCVCHNTVKYILWYFHIHLTISRLYYLLKLSELTIYSSSDPVPW